MARRAALCSLLLWVGLLTACQSGPATPQITTEPLPITSVTVETSSGTPIAFVQGEIPDTCSDIGEINQFVDGQTVYLTIALLRVVRPGAECLNVIRTYDEAHPLTVNLPVGEVVLDVNGVQTPFTVAETTSAATSTAPAVEVNCTGTYDLTFLEDVTIPDGTPVQQGETVIKTWRIQNSGQCDWGSNVTLALFDRDAISVSETALPLPYVPVGDIVDLSITLTVNNDAPIGVAQAVVYELRTPGGVAFGTQLFALITPVAASSAVTVGDSATEVASSAIASTEISGGTLSGVVWDDRCFTNVTAGAGTATPSAPPPGCVAVTSGGYRADGERTANESGLAGVRLALRNGPCDDAKDTVAVAITDAIGVYQFVGLAEGTYCVEINARDASAGVLFPGQFTHPPAATGRTVARITVRVAANKSIENINFGWDFWLR